MKKIILPMFALTATAMLLPSCSSDEILPQGEETTVILTAKLPDGLQTRAFADGKTAKHLQMVVLQADGDRPVGDNLSVFDSGDVYTAEFRNGNLTTEVPVKLVSGKRYAVICWADAGEGISPYAFDTTTHTVTADYTNRTTSDETLDAFYACQPFTVEGNGTQTIELRRPFAQLNIGTDDLQTAGDAGFTATAAEVTVPVYTGFNLVNGEVSNPEVRTFTAAALPTGEQFPASAGTGYEYLAMNYVLTGADKALADEVKLKVTGTGGAPIERTFNTVPMQRNYRTNIYGSILTNTMDFTVVIEPDFDGEFNSVTSFDALADQLNAGKNVQLSSDISAGKTMVIRGNGNVLDLNGKTYSASGPVAIWNTGDWSMFSLRGGELTITGNGTVKPLSKVDDAFAVDVQGGGKLIIEDGNFYGNDHVVYVFHGEAEIRGGRYEMLTTSTSMYYVLNCYDANYKNGTAKITVKGGEFINFNPADCGAEGKHTNFVAPGYISVKQPSNDGKDHYVVMYAGNSSIIFGRTIDYRIPAVDVQFKPAVANSTLTMAAGGEIIGIKGEDKKTSALFIDKNTTVNGTGGVISANEDMSAVIVSYGASLTIDGSNTYTSENGAALSIGNGTATIKGGHFTSTGTNCLICFTGKLSNKLYIQGGVFEGLGELLYFKPDSFGQTDEIIKHTAIEISGGIFVGYQPNAKYLKAGYKFVQTEYNGTIAFEAVPA